MIAPKTAALAYRTVILKRFHLHLHVSDLDASIAFDNRLFGRPADVIKADYVD